MFTQIIAESAVSSMSWPGAVAVCAVAFAIAAIVCTMVKQ